ncbi:MAG: PAS domain S-box protein [Chloroflexi bacterium]|nr:PAS domain S-box protein [Chloroflexota bacterium]
MRLHNDNGCIEGTVASDCAEGSVADVTERRQAQEKLEEAYREEQAIRSELQAEMKRREASQQALQEREELYRLLADNVTDAVFATDANLHSTYVSPSFTRLTGYTIEEAKTLTPEKVLTPASLQAALKVHEEVMALGGEHRDEAMSRTMELEYKRKDGSLTWVEVRAGIVHDAEGRPTGIVYGMRDIAERKRIEEALRRSEEKYRDLFNNAQVALFRMKVSDGTLLEGNDLFVSLAGYGSRQQLLAEWPLPSQAASALRHDILKKVRETGGTGNVEGQITKHDGSAIWVSLSARVYPGSDCIEGAMTDITERKQAEEKLEQAYRQEQAARSELETEMRRRVEFLRVLVHELKTPVTSLMASSELLTLELTGPLLTAAEVVYRSAENLNRRIDELLDLARGELGMLRLHRGPVMPLDLIHDVFGQMAPVIEGRGQTLTLDLPDSLPQIQADDDRLRQVLLNLLSNATKFMGAGQKVTLRARQTDSDLVVEVEDTGPGIDVADQARLFHAYDRLQGDREHLSGLGLGLALSKSLIELHGGRIWVKSQKGEGSTFGFSIPLQG